MIAIDSIFSIWDNYMWSLRAKWFSRNLLFFSKYIAILSIFFDATESLDCCSSIMAYLL